MRCRFGRDFSKWVFCSSNFSLPDEMVSLLLIDNFKNAGDEFWIIHDMRMAGSLAQLVLQATKYLVQHELQDTKYSFMCLATPSFFNEAD